MHVYIHIYIHNTTTSIIHLHFVGALMTWRAGRAARLAGARGRGPGQRCGARFTRAALGGHHRQHITGTGQWQHIQINNCITYI